MTIKNDNQSATLRGNTLVTQDGTTILDVDSTAVRTWIDSRIGTEKPEWRSIIRQGGNATTSYSCGFQRLTPVQLSATATINDKNGPVFTKNRTLSGTPSFWRDYADFPAGLSLTSADSTARLKFLQHYRQRRTQFQGGVFLGELAKTVKMLSSPAKSLRGAIDQYVTTAKKRSRGMKKPHRVIAETWLEYAYGWKPLIHDIEDAARIATAHPFDVFEKVSGRGRSTIERVLTPNLFTSSWLRVLWSLVNEGYVDVKYKGAIRATNSPPPFPEQLGLSWSNVLPTAWELIPYSFLVDYFTNIGKVIDGASSGIVRLAWGCRTAWQVKKTSYEAVRLDQDWLKGNTGPNDTSSGYASGGGEFHSWSIYGRSSVDAISTGLRDVQFKLPGSNTKWLNIGALAAVRFSRPSNLRI
jgi:hypothetical protein